MSRYLSNLPDGQVPFSANVPLQITSDNVLNMSTTPSFVGLSISGTTDSSSVTTGTVVLQGGLGVGKRVFVGNHVTCLEMLNIRGYTAEGAQINLGYRNNTTLAGQSNSHWSIDVDASNVFRIIDYNSSGTPLASFLVNQGTGLITLPVSQDVTAATINTGAVQTGGGFAIGKTLNVGLTSNLGCTYAKALGVGQTMYIAGTNNILNSTVNIWAKDNNGGNTTDTPWPLLNLVKPGVNSQAFDSTATFYIQRYAITGTNANSELQLGLSATTVVPGTDPSVIVNKWRADGTNILLGTADSTSASTGTLQVWGGIGCAKTVNAQKFRSSGGTTFALTTTFQTILNMAEGETGLLTLVNNAGGGTYATFHVTYHSLITPQGISVVGGNNITAAFSGTALQVKCTTSSYTMTWSYMRLL